MSSQDNEMSFLDHLEIFRWHLIRAAAAIMFFAVIAFIYKDIVFDTILLGPRDPNFPTYRVLCSISQYLGLQDALCLEESPFSLMNITMSGQFSTHIKHQYLQVLLFLFLMYFGRCGVLLALHCTLEKLNLQEG